jgi:hypothetical protein
MTASFGAQESYVSSCFYWLWNYSDAEIGLRSSWGCLQSAGSHSTQWTDPYKNDQILYSISNRRQIERAYQSLSPTQQRILFANYGTLYNLPPDILFVFNKQNTHNLAPTVLAISEQIQHHIAICNRIRNRKASLEEHTQITLLSRQAKQAFQQAILTAYQTLPKDINLHKRY